MKINLEKESFASRYSLFVRLNDMFLVLTWKVKDDSFTCLCRIEEVVSYYLKCRDRDGKLFSVNINDTAEVSL